MHQIVVVMIAKGRKPMRLARAANTTLQSDDGEGRHVWRMRAKQVKPSLPMLPAALWLHAFVLPSMTCCRLLHNSWCVSPFKGCSCVYASGACGLLVFSVHAHTHVPSCTKQIDGSPVELQAAMLFHTGRVLDEIDALAVSADNVLVRLLTMSDITAGSIMSQEEAAATRERWRRRDFRDTPESLRQYATARVRYDGLVASEIDPKNKGVQKYMRLVAADVIMAAVAAVEREAIRQAWGVTDDSKITLAMQQAAGNNNGDGVKNGHVDPIVAVASSSSAAVAAAFLPLHSADPMPNIAAADEIIASFSHAFTEQDPGAAMVKAVDLNDKTLLAGGNGRRRGRRGRGLAGKNGGAALSCNDPHESDSWWLSITRGVVEATEELLREER